jgi:hypothetical protein
VHEAEGSVTAHVYESDYRRRHLADIFVTCEGVVLLAAAGIEVVELPEFAELARAANAYLGV